MSLYSVKTRKSPKDVVELARDYFGQNGLGMSVAVEDPCCITFKGGGGHVSVTASLEDERTEVTLETREWDYHVRKFMGRL